MLNKVRYCFIMFSRRGFEFKERDRILIVDTRGKEENKMRVILGSDLDGIKLKAEMKQYLLQEKVEVIDKSESASEDFSESASEDFIEATLAVAHEVLKDTESLGIVFDGYGAGSFMTAAKIKGMIVAELSDERSAYMAREHNNARMITVGAKIVGTELAKNIIKEFLTGHYAGGRHQIRVDMLNKMA